jgi:uroporphyrin-III C-methyltransferase
MKRKVYLVGAGPGDPELLTLKARRILSEASVVLHDELVNPEILQFAPPSARIESVGKRCGRHQFSQEAIHSLMVASATEGLTVVRLQGGDPLVFGRAGEEMEALRRAGIEFEVVPGVTAASGAAAGAGIPLTDRRMASSVVFLTNHSCAGKNALFEKHSFSNDTTVVVYMPGTDYQSLAAGLRQAGLDPQTSCLVVSQATSAQQQVHATRLENLPEAPRLPAPALLIIGKVAENYSVGPIRPAIFSAAGGSLRG